MNILDQIIDTKKSEVNELKKQYSLESFTGMEFFGQTGLSFIDRAKKNKNISIIAEIKKVSPSRGIIKEDFDHLEIASAYIKNNVDAISVLTDQEYFMGNIFHLADIAKFRNCPLLRKDFIIDEIQVYEAKAFGADLILLISEALSKNQINELTTTAKEIGLEVLLELHSSDQLEKIDFELNDLIGINNRNLKDFSVSLESTKIISNEIPDNAILISESGISNAEDLDYLKQTRAKGILVGEHLMSSDHIDQKITELKKWCKIED